jgi:hypothetical protein
MFVELFAYDNVRVKYSEIAGYHLVSHHIRKNMSQPMRGPQSQQAICCGVNLNTGVKCAKSNEPPVDYKRFEELFPQIKD